MEPGGIEEEVSPEVQAEAEEEEAEAAAAEERRGSIPSSRAGTVSRIVGRSSAHARSSSDGERATVGASAWRQHRTPARRLARKLLVKPMT